VAEPLPELEVGAEPELKPLEPVELELEPLELEPEPVEPVLDPVEPVLEPEEPDPVLPDEVDPELLELDGVVEEEPELVEEDAAVCVEPGRTSAIAPAAATLDRVTTVVAERTLARPFSLAALARRRASRCALLMSAILRSRIGSLLYGTSRLDMSRPIAPSHPQARLAGEHEGQLKTFPSYAPAAAFAPACDQPCGGDQAEQDGGQCRSQQGAAGAEGGHDRPAERGPDRRGDDEQRAAGRDDLSQRRMFPAGYVSAGPRGGG
jgi:hypothetical protein